MTLNLEAKTKGERKIKTYLEANASDILAEKINNGVHIQKAEKALINKRERKTHGRDDRVAGTAYRKTVRSESGG